MQEAFQHILDSLRKWQPNHEIVLESLRQAGSNRQYFRFKHDGESYILTYNPANAPENNAFVEFTHHFSGKGLNVPSIIYTDDAMQFYVQSDLGMFPFLTTLPKKGFLKTS